MAIIALLGAAGLLFLFGEMESLLHPSYALTINMNRAAGVREGSTVELNGVPVGVVERVSLQSDRDHPVRVWAAIDEGVRIPMNAMPQVQEPLIGGGSVMQLVASMPAQPDASQFLPADGSAELTGEHRSITETVKQELDRRMEPVVASLEEFQKLAQTYTALGEELNSLFQPQNAEELESGAAPNLRTAVLRINTVLEQTSQALELAQGWLSDDQLRGDVTVAVRKATTLIEEATKTVQQYGQLAQKLEGDTERIVQAVLPVADDLAATLEEVRRLTVLARTGNGTVAQLLNNPDLYVSLNDAALRLERALLEAQLLVQKLRAEGVRVGF